MQSAPIPLLSSLISLNNHHSDHLHSLSDIPSKGNNHHTINKMPKSTYNETAISTELECFISKSSSSDSLRINEDEIEDLSLSSSDSVSDDASFDDDLTDHDTVISMKETDACTLHSDGSKLELVTIDETGTTTQSPEKKEKRKYSKLRKQHRKLRRRHYCDYQPQWLMYLSSLDRLFSSKVHRLSCGSIDYLFVFGAFVFGSKFMPITILLSIFLVDVPGFIYLLLSCTITVSVTQFGKKFFGRHRPDPKTLAPKKLDFRTRLTNYSFPSGDTAQAAAYSTSLFCLTNNMWLLLLIPNCAWSRVYFGCHWICDCIIGAIIGCFIPLLIYSMIPQQSFINTQEAILNLMH